MQKSTLRMALLQCQQHVALQTTSGKPASTKVLEDYCKDLCQQARDKSIDVVRPAPCHCVCPASFHSGQLVLQHFCAVVYWSPQYPAEHLSGASRVRRYTKRECGAPVFGMSGFSSGCRCTADASGFT